MSLDLTLLKKTKNRGDKIIAQCPACAETGGDTDGTHLATFPDGRFACVKFQGDTEHRRRIFELAGLRTDTPAAASFVPSPAKITEPPPVIDWQVQCTRLARDAGTLQRLANWRGWTPEFCQAMAEAGVIGLHEGRIAFPVHTPEGQVIGRHVFQWPEASHSGPKAWYSPGKNAPLIIAASSLENAREAHVLESQWDALSLLHAKNWNGAPLDKPFVVTRGTSINPRLTECLAGVHAVTLWPQRDEVKPDGKAPSETWLERCLCLLPPSVTTIRRADTPEPFKDWGDVIRANGAAAALTAIKTALRTAADVPRRATNATLAALPLNSSAPCHNLRNLRNLQNATSQSINTHFADSADIDEGDSTENTPPINTHSADNADIGERDSTEEAASVADPFPLDALPDALRKMASEAARVSLAPDVLTVCCTLGAVSASIGGGLEVDSGGERRTRGNLYLLPVAASGTGKGRAFDLLMRPFTNAELDAVFDWRERTLPRANAELMAAEARLKKHRDSLAKNAEPESGILEQYADADRAREAAKLRTIEPAWSTADCTKEKLTELLSENPSETLASLSPEARGVVDVLAGRYTDGKSDESVYLSAYTGETCKVHRKSSQPVILKRPCLTVLWMLQPDKLHEMLKNSALTESGLMPRFLLCDTKAEPAKEPEVWPVMDAAVQADWSSLIRELVAMFRSRGKEPLLITTAPEVQAIFRDYFNSVVEMRSTGGELADVSAYAARWGENAWRLAVVLHAAKNAVQSPYEPLTAETANQAVEIMRWFSRQQLALLSAGRTERRAKQLDTLKAALQGFPEHRASYRELERRHHIPREEVATINRTFPGILIVSEGERTGKAGRPSAGWVQLVVSKGG